MVILTHLYEENMKMQIFFSKTMILNV